MITQSQFDVYFSGLHLPYCVCTSSITCHPHIHKNNDDEAIVTPMHCQSTMEKEDSATTEEVQDTLTTSMEMDEDEDVEELQSLVPQEDERGAEQ